MSDDGQQQFPNDELIGDEEQQFPYENEYEEYIDYLDAIAHNYDWPFNKLEFSIHLNNELAKDLGIALHGNTHLECLGVSLDANVLNDGIQSLVNGIMSSKLQTMCVYFPYHRSGPSLEVLDIFYSGIVATVKSLEFTTPITDVDASVICELFRRVGPASTLQNLSLQQSDGTGRPSNLSVHGAQLLARGLAASNIRCLSLAWFGEGSQELLSTLYYQGVSASSVDNLTIIGDAGDMQVLALHSLKTLTIKQAKFNIHDIQMFGSGLQQPNLIQYLELHECGVDNEQMVTLSTALNNNVLVKTLILSRNAIGDTGLFSFVSNWTEASTLEKLDLRYNCIGQLGAQRLLQMSSQRSSLKHLDLSGNRQIGYTGLHFVAQELRNNIFLRELLLVEVTTWMPQGTKKEKQELSLVVNLAAESILNTLKYNIHIREFVFDDLELRRHQYFPNICFFRQFNACGIRSMVLQQEILPPSFWCFVLAKFPTCPSIVFSFLCEVPGLIFSSRNETN
jgi:hypothetical protein